jgi:hypothetical protein
MDALGPGAQAFWSTPLVVGEQNAKGRLGPRVEWMRENLGVEVGRRGLEMLRYLSRKCRGC